MTSLWDGGPGTGKSYVAKALCTAANFLSGHDGTVVCCAPSGVAAALIPGARTIHNLGDMKPTEACRAVPLKAMNPATKAEYAVRLGPGTAYILLIDEISMVEACLYGHLQDRCAEIRRVGTEAKTEWGGLAVVAVGDFGQLAPVGKSLYKQALNVFSDQLSFDVAETAGRLFQAIRRYPLTEQVFPIASTAWKPYFFEYRILPRVLHATVNIIGVLMFVRRFEQLATRLTSASLNDAVRRSDPLRSPIWTG